MNNRTNLEKTRKAIGILMALILISPALCAQDTRPTVAIIDFEGRGITQLEAQTLTDRFSTSIGNTGAVRLVERSAMNEILEEQGFQQSGCTTDECAVEAGKLLGVQYVAGGAIGKVGGTFMIDARMISVETGVSVRVRSINYEGRVEGLIVEIEILAYELVEMVPPEDLLERRKFTTQAFVSQSRAPKVRTKTGAMMRSLIFPGFGQLYVGRKLWGYGWILSEVAMAGLMVASYSTYQMEHDNYNTFVDRYRKETNVAKITQYKAQARKSHEKMDAAKGQIKMLSVTAGGIWLANVVHAFVAGPRGQSDDAYREFPLRLAYDLRTRQPQLRMTIVLD